MSAMRVPELKHGNTYLGELHGVLKKGFPQFRNRQGGLHVASLAEHLEYSFQNIYLWFKNNRLPPHAATTIVDRSAGRITLGQLEKFVYVSR